MRDIKVVLPSKRSRKKGPREREREREKRSLKYISSTCNLEGFLRIHFRANGTNNFKNLKKNLEKILKKFFT
jgi:hypothetical protein